MFLDRTTARTAQAPLSDAAHVRPAAATTRTLDLSLAAQLVAIVVAGGWIGYFLFTGMPQLTLHVFPRTLALHLMFAGLATVYIASLAAMRRLPGLSMIGAAALLFGAAYALATLTSISWRVSLEPALYLLAAIVVFFALADLPWLSAEALRRAFLLACLALAIYALWIVGDDYVDYLRLVRRVEGLSGSNIFPPTVPRAHDVSDHPNVLAMVLALAMPFFAVAAIEPLGRWERALGVAGLLAGGMALFLTLSRGSWIGAAAGITFALGAMWLTMQAHDRERHGFAPSWENMVPRNVSPTALATLAGAVVLIVGGTLAFLSSASTRPGWLFRGSLSPREDAWEASLNMFADYPLLGSGPHTFGLLYPQESGRFLVHTQHAHNGFLQVANDTGIVGLLALAVLGAAVVFTLVRTWRDGDLGQRLLASACAGALVAFSVHNLLDAGNIWKAPPIALAVVGAIIVRNDRERVRAVALSWPRALARVPQYGRRAAGIALAVAPLAVIVAIAFAWWRIDSAHYDYYLGADAYNTRDDGAIGRLQAAVDADSSHMPYRLLLGQALAQEFIEGGMADRSLIDRAVVNLEQAVEIDDRSDIARANLARAYQLAGRNDDAAAQAQLTRLAANHVAPVLAVAEVYELLGRDADAVSTYGQVLSMDASLAGSTYWDGTPWRREHFGEIIAASALGLNPCTNGAYLAQAPDGRGAAGDLGTASDGCKLLLLEFPNDLTLRVALAQILRARGELEEARGHAAYAVDRQPDFGPARTELGRLLADAGDLEAARHEWVVGAELGEPESVMLLGESYRPEDRPDALAGRLEDLLARSGTSIQNDVVSVIYYRLRWGRLSPVLPIIPGDWQTAVPRLYQQMRETLARWQSED